VEREWRLSLDEAALAAVVYADLFDFPLTAREIHRGLIGRSASDDVVQDTIHRLLATGRLAIDRAFYVIPGRAGLALLREERTRRAARLWPVARRFGQFLAIMPFVRAVIVSGSLAVGNPDPAADVDFLLITAPGRLWLVRAIAILIVRFARLTGAQICPNYLLSTQALVLAQRDLFTAHELLQTVPLSGHEVYSQLRAANLWTATWLPNWPGADSAFPTEPSWRGRSVAFGQRLGEAVLGGFVGDRFERWEGIRKRQRLQPLASDARFSADVCEGHFGRHRERITRRFAERCAQVGISEPQLAASLDSVSPGPTVSVNLAVTGT
jgi:hypothetical protein